MNGGTALAWRRIAVARMARRCSERATHTPSTRARHGPHRQVPLALDTGSQPMHGRCQPNYYYFCPTRSSGSRGLGNALRLLSRWMANLFIPASVCGSGTCSRILPCQSLKVRPGIDRVVWAALGADADQQSRVRRPKTLGLREVAEVGARRGCVRKRERGAAEL